MKPTSGVTKVTAQSFYNGICKDLDDCKYENKDYYNNFSPACRTSAEPEPAEQHLYTELYIWGGEDQDVYLGKLNGSKYDSESIWNEYGKYGGEYSIYSPFNQYASDPPVLRDSNGKFYGYFTANRYKAKRARYDVIDTICDNYESISEDVDEWYEKLF